MDPVQHVKAAIPSSGIASRKADPNSIENHGVIVIALPHKVDNFTDLSQRGSRIAKLETFNKIRLSWLI